MELIIHPSSKSNQQTFKLNDVKAYKFTGTYTVEVEFNSGSKESYYSIESVEVIQTKSKFESGSQWYYIDRQGFIQNFIIHSGLSPNAAEALAGIYTVYSDWNQAYEALNNYNKNFTTFITTFIK